MDVFEIPEMHARSNGRKNPVPISIWSSSLVILYGTLVVVNQCSVDIPDLFFVMYQQIVKPAWVYNWILVRFGLYLQRPSRAPSALC